MKTDELILYRNVQDQQLFAAMERLLEGDGTAEELSLIHIFRLIIQVKENMIFLNHRQIREINAGKGIIAFGPLFFSPSAGNDLAVEYHHHIMGCLLYTSRCV